MTQRDTMRKLCLELGGIESLVVEAYAAAEDRGEVKRKSNAAGWTSRTYAQALWNDGIRHGWLPLAKGIQASNRE